MAEEIYLLSIHTTGETALVTLSGGRQVLGTEINHEFKKHATFLHPAIEKLLKEQNITAVHLKAVSVTHGPGSYTGIRVGLAAAKGLCYALKIPLITLNTLDVMAASAIHKVNDHTALFCPMIDARRMEVYTAMYDYNQVRLSEPQAIILDPAFSEEFLKINKVYFFGNGSMKFKDLVKKISDSSQYFFREIEVDPLALAELSYQNFSETNFSDLAYSEPEYLKEFKSTTN